MLLLLENTSNANITKLLEYARQLDLRLTLLDDESNTTLPGKPISPSVLKSMIEQGRKMGTISLETAHNAIRKNLNAD